MSRSNSLTLGEIGQNEILTDLSVLHIPHFDGVDQRETQWQLLSPVI